MVVPRTATTTTITTTTTTTTTTTMQRAAHSMGPKHVPGEEAIGQRQPHLLCPSCANAGSGEANDELVQVKKMLLQRLFTAMARRPVHFIVVGVAQAGERFLEEAVREKCEVGGQQLRTDDASARVRPPRAQL